MNTIARWNPLRELEEFQTRILNAFRPSSAPGQGQQNGAEGFTQSAWLPPVNIAEDDKEYVITADLPEVSPKDVKVTLENGLLSITGERTGEKEEKARKYHLMERSYGAFARSFALPADGDAKRVQAHFKDGVLTVRVPKSDEARPKLIEVKTT
jgi:HSP20 family protein